MNRVVDELDKQIETNRVEGEFDKQLDRGTNKAVVELPGVSNIYGPFRILTIKAFTGSDALNYYPISQVQTLQVNKSFYVPEFQDYITAAVSDKNCFLTTIIELILSDTINETRCRLKCSRRDELYCFTAQG